MKINIYYGGRGLIEDPTIYVMNKITEVLEELRVEVVRYNLFEQKNGIAMLPNTLKDVDGVILAVNVEWMGIGGLMQMFLDSCWLYADKNKLKRLFMFPVVVANTIGEREAELNLIKAWELLGGTACNCICTYVENHIDFETDTAYASLIEKKAEDLYRVVKQKGPMLPTSINAVVQPLTCGTGIELTPQESEQLSVYVSDDTYVKKQKEDIEELSQLFKNMMEQGKDESRQEFIKYFKDKFKPMDDEFKASYLISMTDSKRNLIIDVNNKVLKCYYGTLENPDVSVKTTRDVVNKLVNGRTTFQGAFMSSMLTCKGDFKLLRTFDQLFRFDI